MKGVTCIEDECNFKNECPIIKHFYERGSADERAKSLDDIYSIIISDIGDKEKVLKIQEVVFKKKGITNGKSERI